MNKTRRKYVLETKTRQENGWTEGFISFFYDKNDFPKFKSNYKHLETMSFELEQGEKFTIWHGDIDIVSKW